ncbi:hypothetical protein HK104_006153 [Borealophlyctis nickersoniae]|nr:hypothetical protein HK104_006153 [Borealophlyctis nickersoniae]
MYLKPPSKKDMKPLLANMLNAEKYLTMDSADRLEFFGDLIEVLANDEEDRRKEGLCER